MPSSNALYNCYYNPYNEMRWGYAENNDPPFGPSGGNYNLTEWQNEYGWDINSYETNPLFNDVENMDFTPLAPECSGKGILINGYTIKTEKKYYILGIN